MHSRNTLAKNSFVCLLTLWKTAQKACLYLTQNSYSTKAVTPGDCVKNIYMQMLQFLLQPTSCRPSRGKRALGLFRFFLNLCIALSLHMTFKNLRNMSEFLKAHFTKTAHGQPFFLSSVLDSKYHLHKKEERKEKRKGKWKQQYKHSIQTYINECQNKQITDRSGQPLKSRTEAEWLNFVVVLFDF